MANPTPIYIEAETGLITTDEVARVRMMDFALQYGKSVKKLAELLGVVRKYEVTEGTQLKALTVTGTLGSGSVDEGEIIPLSQYETEDTVVGEITLKKWRKSTSAEAILKGGYEQAVGRTTDKMVRDIQKTVRGSLIDMLGDGTGTASGIGLQKAFANAWGALQVAFEDEDVELIFFANPVDVAEYLGSANITTQSEFGMTYIENFLGLGTVFLTASVTAGTFYATAKDNIVMNYVNAGSGDIGRAFNMTTDELGIVGISEYTDKDRMTVDDVVISGIAFFPEMLAGVIVGEIEEEPAPDPDAGSGSGGSVG